MKKILLLILFFVQSSLFAQEKYTSSNTRAIGAYERSTVYLGQKLYNTALKDLQIALSIDPNFLEAHYRMGDILKVLGRYEEAKTSYLKVTAQANTFKNINFSLAECYAFQANYDSAYPLFQIYSSTPDLSDNRKKALAKYLRDCEFSIEAVQQPVPYDPINLGPSINTQYQEYLPAITADDQTIIFTRRANTEDFFIAQKNEDSWNPSLPLSSAINTPGNEGAQCISPDGQYLFFAGCGRADGLGKCDIYYAKKVGDKWSSPQNLGTPINSQYWESQPTISADGKTLYFVSDRKGGYGSYDIYKSTYTGAGKWSTPLNLGPNINTAGEEFSPFIHADNQTLYFTSDGLPGYGGSDLFILKKLSNGKWGTPENMGYPINTIENEGSLAVAADGYTAYYASDREDSRGGLDIYSFTLPTHARPYKTIYIKGNITDLLTKKGLPANLELTDNASGTIINKVQTDELGHYFITLPEGKDYTFTVNRKGYLFYSSAYALSTAAPDSTYIKNIALEPIKLASNFVFTQVLFDNNSYALLPASLPELNKLVQILEENPGMHIQISGHTDNIGKAADNLTLSTNRAKAIVQYVSGRGVATDRLTYKGFGSTEPIATNATQEGRALNRRTSFTITKL